MATSEQYAEWIVRNQDKKGTSEFDTVAKAYRQVRGEGQQQSIANQLLESAKPMGAGERFMQGARDPLDAAAQMATRALPESVVGGVNRATQYVNELPVVGPITKALGMTPATSGDIDRSVQERERSYRPPAGFDFARLGGNVASTLPAAAVLPVGAGLGARTAIGAASGGAFGALQPVTENQDKFWSEKAKQAGTGAAVGAVAAPIMGGIARMVSPRTSTDVKALMKEGVTPSMGSILGGAAKTAEDKLQSVPILGDAITYSKQAAVKDLNRAAFKRVLAPLGKPIPKEVGREGFSKVAQTLSDAYNDLLPRLKFKADQQFAGELNNLRTMAANLSQPEAEQFEKIVRNQVVGKFTPQGNASGETVKAIESELGRLARGYSKDASFDKRQLGSALTELQAAIRRTLQRINPQHADELAKINEGYANFARVRDAVSRQGSPGGVFSPAQLSAAVRSQDKSVGKGAFAKGTALMQDLSDPAKAVLGPSYPDSGTAGRVMMGAGALASGAIHPGIPAGLGIASLPYLPGGRQIAAGILASRPAGAESVASALRRAPVGLLAPPLYELSNQ